MNRTQLEHIIRAAAGHADTTEIVVIGSQAILGTYPAAPELVRERLAQTTLPESARAPASDRLLRLAGGGGR